MAQGWDRERDFARRYGARLLADLERPEVEPAPTRSRSPAEAWRASGLDACTGRPHGPPLMAPAALASCAEGALAALAALAGRPEGLPRLDGAVLLGERARVAGLSRQGRASPGGGCRLIATADGGLAVSLVRGDDWAALPAWLDAEVSPTWEDVEAAATGRSTAWLVERGRLLGLAIASVLPPEPARGGWAAVARLGDALARDGRPPRVVDLSSLWAGPLCTRLLALAGAEVVKVESLGRPDGARGGPAEVYDRLNAAKRAVALDFAAPEGRAALRALVRWADVVVESARPRALRQLGIEAEALVREVPGLTWISLTGYGREPPFDQAVGFGDDAAAGAGLAARMAQAHGEPLFCGDAIADPLAGLHAALAALACHQAGGGRLAALSLHGVAAHALAADPSGAEGLRARTERWTREAASAPPAPLPPHPGPARPLGADTAGVLEELYR